jgi:hypothetical protein
MDDLRVSSSAITLIISRHYANYTTLDEDVSMVAVHSVDMS